MGVYEVLTGTRSEFAINAATPSDLYFLEASYVQGILRARLDLGIRLLREAKVQRDLLLRACASQTLKGGTSASSLA